MASIKLYLDTRRLPEGKAAPIKLLISAGGTTTTHTTNISVLPEQWNPVTRQIEKHPEMKYLNTMLNAIRSEWEVAMLDVCRLSKTKINSATTLKKMILARIDPDTHPITENLFLTRFAKFVSAKNSEGTRRVYGETVVKLRQFDSLIDQRTFEDINKDYLTRFEQFLMQTAKSANARAIHFRNIRAVFNDAIDDEVTAAYPFRKFKIKQQPTSKRSLSVEELRTLMDYPCEEWQEIYRDMFVLMFYLCGINAVDLFNAKPDAIRNGRFEYVRAKTHKAYSVKVEPEAMKIIRRYSGKNYLLNIMDTRANYKDFLHKMGNALKKIGSVERVGRGGKKVRTPLFPGLSQYWCRHTWATIAAGLDIPKETIAAGLGHEMGNTTTAIYINFDQKKVDEANRKIIDYVLSV